MLPGYIWQLLNSLYTCNRAQEQAQYMQNCPQENPVGSSLILLEPQQINGHHHHIWHGVDTIRESPKPQPMPQFLQHSHELRSHFDRALKKIPRPQSPVNGWAGVVMSLEMYILINPTPFHLNIAPTTATPAYPIKYNPEGVMVCVCVSGLRLWLGYCKAWDSNL